MLKKYLANNSSGFFKAVLLLLVISSCLCLRIHFNYSQEFSKRHFYSKLFRPVLSYVEGFGMKSFAEAGVNSENSKLVNDFLSLELKTLDRKVLRAYLHENRTGDFIPQFLLQPIGYYVRHKIKNKYPAWRKPSVPVQN